MAFLNLEDEEARALLLLLGIVAIIGIFALLDIDNFQNLIFSSVVYILIIIISTLIFFAKDIFDRFAPHGFQIIGIDTKGRGLDLGLGVLLGVVFVIVNYAIPAVTIGIPAYFQFAGKLALTVGVAPYVESILLLSIVLPLLMAFLPIRNLYLRGFVAGILDGLIFGLLHYAAYGNLGANLTAFYTAIGFGIIFAWLALWQNSIIGPAIAHTIINAAILTKQTLSIGTLTIVPFGLSLSATIPIVLFTIIGIVGLLVTLKYWRKEIQIHG